MPSTRIAVAGLGNAASSLHLPALSSLPGITLVGGCDPRPEARAAAAARWKLPVFESPEAMLAAAPCDVLLVVTPPATHLAVALAGFAAGAHVICEKPIAPTVADAGRMIEAASAAGRRLAVNQEFREMPAYRAVLDAVGGDPGGAVFAQVWQLMDLPPWKEPGWRGILMRGVLYEAGIHLVDYLLATFRAQPVAVTAVTGSSGEREEETDSVAALTLEFPGGRLAQLLQHRLCRGDTQYFEARVDTRTASYRVSYGGRARVSAGLLRSRTPHLRLELGTSGLAWREQGAGRSILAKNPADAPSIATRLLLERTLAAFAGHGQPPATGEDARDVLEVIAAAYRSSAEGRRVVIAEERDALATIDLSDGVRAARLAATSPAS